MLSYRHTFHAGNPADVLKHYVLFTVLSYFNQKDKPYLYIDTHAGAGFYDLQSQEAQKNQEYEQGIARLKTKEHFPLTLQDFSACLTQIAPDANFYPGSPFLAAHCLRESDKLRLFELHPTDFEHLRENMRKFSFGRRLILKKEDGFRGLISLLPPLPRRAIILIDPPYEQKSDYQTLIVTMQEAVKRFATGCYLIWYPCLQRVESENFCHNLTSKINLPFVNAELHTHAPRADGFGMYGSGMIIFNPPYTLHGQLAETLPILEKLLANQNGKISLQKRDKQ